MEALQKWGVHGGLLFLRISIGLTMLLAHGWGKMTNFSAIAPKFMDFIGLGGSVSLALAVFSEVFCSVFIIIGLKTRIASAFLAITMFVAAFMVHLDDPFKVKEKALLFLFAYITLMLTGGGKFSIKE